MTDLTTPALRPFTGPTALVALTLDDAERLCDRLNARLGLDRRAWTALAERSGLRGDHSLH